MVDLLRGHGGTLKRVTMCGDGSTGLLESAVQSGALPNLTYFRFSPEDPAHRQIVSSGMLSLLEEIEVTTMQVDEEQLAVLGHLRRLQHLKSFELMCHGAEEAASQFPPFIPPSLKSVDMTIYIPATLASLLRDLPSMLRASGANLEKIDFTCAGELHADFGAALAQVFRSCASTLKTLKLSTRVGDVFSRECIHQLVPGLMSCCNTLEVLHCPWAVFSALPATCPTFPRLIELSLDGEIDLTSPAWGIIADGRVPALASLGITVGRNLLLGRPEGEGFGRLVRAFEAVAGTLKRLRVSRGWAGQGYSMPAGACHELGAAIGKLRRLRYLFLSLSQDGRDLHAVGRGMADSGGCPELFWVQVHGLERNYDWLTFEPSLIAPSVRDLHIEGHSTEEEALVLCCALVQLGYKYRAGVDLRDFHDYPLVEFEECMLATLCGGGMNAHVD
jgi:hypothetical protein